MQIVTVTGVSVNNSPPVYMVDSLNLTTEYDNPDTANDVATAIANRMLRRGHQVLLKLFGKPGQLMSPQTGAANNGQRNSN